MKIAIYIGKTGQISDSRITGLLADLTEGGCLVYHVGDDDDLQPDTDMLMSVGGDGTYLSASMIAARHDVKIVGVNLGRLGFLSENRPEDVSKALLSGNYRVEDSALLSSSDGSLALNEMTVHRSGAAILGMEVSVDGVRLPTYWADGLIISTGYGSTAYSLSCGGPIVLPESGVLLITPIAPHNLNVRPLVVPDTSLISIRLHSRDERVVFTADNRTMDVSPDVQIDINVARFSLKRVRLNNSDFINALTEKLHWGEDIRNNR